MNPAAAGRPARGLLKDGGWALGLRIALLVSGFASTAFLARLMPPEDLGAYFVCASFAGFLALAIQLGLPSLAMREIAQARAQGDMQHAGRLGGEMIAGVAVVGVALVGIAVLAATLGAASLLNTSADSIVLTAVLAVCLAVQASLGETFRGFGRVAEASLHSGTAAAILLALALGGAWLSGAGLSLRAALEISALTGVAAIAWAAWTGPCKPRRPRWREALWEARAFWLATLGTCVLFQSDLWIAGAILPLEQVAVYGVAFRLVQPLLLPPEAAESALAPRLVALHVGRDVQAVNDTVGRLASAQFLVVFAGAIALAVVAGPLAAVMFGPEFRAAGAVVPLLAAGWSVRALMGPFGPVLQLTHHAALAARLVLVWGALGLAIRIASGSAWGMIGLAAGTAATIAGVCIAGWWLALRATGYNTAPRWLRWSQRRPG